MSELSIKTQMEKNSFYLEKAAEFRRIASARADTDPETAKAFQEMAEEIEASISEAKTINLTAVTRLKRL